MNPDGSLNFPNGVTKADVSMQNLATVNVAGGGGGSITVNARNLDISGVEIWLLELHQVREHLQLKLAILLLMHREQ